MEKMMKIVGVSLMVMIAAALAGCPSEETNNNTNNSSASLCGKGYELDLDGASYCIYKGQIIEEGFDCPPGLPNRYSFSNFSACGGMPEPPVGFEAKVRAQDPDLKPVEDMGPQLDINFGPGPDMGSDLGADMGGTSVELFGDCQTPEPSAVTSTDVKILFEGGGSYGTGPFGDPITVIDNAQDWTTAMGELSPYGMTMEAELDFSGETIDFATQAIVIVHGYASSSCFGELLESANIVDYSGTHGLDITMHYKDGSCPAVCDAEAHSLVVATVNVGAGETPKVCMRYKTSCQQEP